MRKPLEGVSNIVRFNWHFYVIFLFVVASLYLLLKYFVSNPAAVIAVLALVVPVIISLMVSFWVYDRSELYSLKYLEDMQFDESHIIVNINAGFDETSGILHARFPKAILQVYDFYNPERHTEVSIKRARKAYPPYQGSVSVETTALPMESGKTSAVFIIMSAHEIRDHEERISFFREVQRILSPEGRVVVVEHLRDLPNFLAYTVGVFHFFSKKNWLTSFSESELLLEKEIKITPFVSTFILSKNGTTS